MGSCHGGYTESSTKIKQANSEASDEFSGRNY